MVFEVFRFYLTLSVPEKFKKSIFENPINSQTLNINNLRTKSAKSINLDINRKVIKYYSKKFLEKSIFTLTIFEILMFNSRSILPPPPPIHPREVQGAKGWNHNLKHVFLL